MKQTKLRVKPLLNPEDIDGVVYANHVMAIKVNVESGTVLPLWLVPAGTLISKVTVLVSETLNDSSAVVNVGFLPSDYDDLIDAENMYTAGTVKTSLADAPHGYYCATADELTLFLDSSTVSEGELMILVEFFCFEDNNEEIDCHIVLDTIDNLGGGLPVS